MFQCFLINCIMITISWTDISFISRMTIFRLCQEFGLLRWFICCYRWHCLEYFWETINNLILTSALASIIIWSFKLETFTLHIISSLSLTSSAAVHTAPNSTQMACLNYAKRTNLLKNIFPIPTTSSSSWSIFVVFASDHWITWKTIID